ncbi:MAG: LysR family transcriptional regulator [Pseudomonadales bacterium]
MSKEIDTRGLTKLGTLRQLEIFMSIARQGSIGRAAQELHLSQPSVSMQVRKLSEAIGLPLYELMGKKLNLTDAGREVQAAGEEIFGSIESLKNRLDEMKGLQQGVLRIAVVSTAKYFLYHVLGPFCDEFPGVEVEFKVGNRQEIIARMAANLDDLYIVGEPPEDIDLVTHPFLPNPIVVVASKKHDLAKRKAVSWDELLDQRFLLREEGSGTRYCLEQHFDQINRAMPRGMTIQSNEAIKYAVMANMGVSMLSAYVLFDAKEMTQLPVEGFPIMSQWHIAHLRQKQLAPVAQRFLSYMLEHGPQLLPMARIQDNISAAKSGRWNS